MRNKTFHIYFTTGQWSLKMSYRLYTPFYLYLGTDTKYMNSSVFCAN